MSTEQIIELLEKVIVPIVTGIIGFFAGSHIERRKYNSKIKNNNSTVSTFRRAGEKKWLDLLQLLIEIKIDMEKLLPDYRRNSDSRVFIMYYDSRLHGCQYGR